MVVAGQPQALQCSSDRERGHVEMTPDTTTTPSSHPAPEAGPEKAPAGATGLSAYVRRRKNRDEGAE